MPVVIQSSMTSSACSMWSALTLTPSTSTRGIDRSSELRNMAHLSYSERFGDLCFDPAIGAVDPFLERDLRFPPKHFAQPVVVRVAATYALWTGHVPLGDRDAGR